MKQMDRPDGELKMPRGPDLGWREHPIRVGDGKGGWNYQKGEYQFLHAERDVPPAHGSAIFGAVKAYGITQMDNGEVVILVSWMRGEKLSTDDFPLVAFSSDRGDTWSDWKFTGARSRPMMFTNLGGGNLSFRAEHFLMDPSETDRVTSFYSSDYGRTWPEQVRFQSASNGGPWWVEGNPLVDCDESGKAIRIAEIGYNELGNGKIRKDRHQEPNDCFFRWSHDGGRTWVDEVMPDGWRQVIEFEKGKTYTRCVCEGSLVRAANGWLVASLRTNLHPDLLKKFSRDNGSSVVTSISKDEGKTWSTIQDVIQAGRNHSNLLCMKNGDLVMTYVMRQDYSPDLNYNSYRRGCGALISRDNGLTWDVSRQYLLDEFEYTTPSEGASSLACGHIASCLLDDGTILTTYSHYPCGAAAVIRWRP